MFKRLFSNRGEGGAGDAGGNAGGGDAGGSKDGGAGKMFTQEQVDKIMADRWKDTKILEEQVKELSKFKSEHEKQQDLAKQKQLEEQGAYEEAKKTYEGKIGELSNVISQKDQAINDMKVGSALQYEINKQNAVSEVGDLIKGLASVQEDGSIKIKGKDVNGLDTLLSVEQGVAQFLKDKPYLVKANKGGGSGSTNDAGQGGSGSTNEDMTSLNEQLMKAMQSGDFKLQTEIAAKIKKKQAEAGISSHI